MQDPDFIVIKPDYIKKWRGFNTVYAYADLWKRLLNFLVDTTLIVFSFSLISGLISSLWLATEKGQLFVRDIFVFVLFIVWYVCYYYFFETWKQKTPAKYLTRTKVRHRGEGIPSPKQIWLRSLARLMPFEMLSIANQGDFNSTWWHDRWSKVKVVNNAYPDEQAAKSYSLLNKEVQLAYISPVIGGIFYFILWQILKLAL